MSQRLGLQTVTVRDDIMRAEDVENDYGYEYEDDMYHQPRSFAPQPRRRFQQPVRQRLGFQRNRITGGGFYSGAGFYNMYQR